MELGCSDSFGHVRPVRPRTGDQGPGPSDPRGPWGPPGIRDSRTRPQRGLGTRDQGFKEPSEPRISPGETAMQFLFPPCRNCSAVSVSCIATLGPKTRFTDGFCSFWCPGGEKLHCSVFLGRRFFSKITMVPHGSSPGPQGIPAGAQRSPRGFHGSPRGAHGDPTGSPREPTGRPRQPTGTAQEPMGSLWEPAGAPRELMGSRRALHGEPTRAHGHQGTGRCASLTFDLIFNFDLAP